jgi:hypothetical protein
MRIDFNNNTWSNKLTVSQERVRKLRLKARIYYRKCNFEVFKRINRLANQIEHEMKMFTQPEVKGT